MFRRRKFWKRLIIGLVVTPIVLLTIVIALLYWKQDEVVRYVLDTFNEDFVGEIEIRDSHISPFSNFPHFTIDLEGLKIWEGKDKHNIRPIIEVEDAYIGFNIWTILSGQLDIDYIRLENGELDLIMHEDGSFNVVNALSSPNETKVEDIAEEFHIHLKSIEAVNLDIHKLNEATDLDIEAFVKDAEASFQTASNHTGIELESNFVLNVIDRGDTTVIRHKHFFIDTHLDYKNDEGMLVIEPSEMTLEHGEFKIDGTLDVMDSLNLDLNIHGNKPNFDLFIAFAPEELIPVLESYENAGDIFFEANVKGKATHGIPAVNVDFGVDKAYLKNTRTSKEVRDMHFEGHFTNTLNAKHDLTAMEFSLKNIHAIPEAGFFDGDILVRNFVAPEIDMTAKSDFRLDFLSRFFDLNDLSDLRGQVLLNMKFHDIIDLANPQHAIEKMNEAYDSELIIKNLSFRKGAFYLPIDSVNAKIHMEGHKAAIDYVDLKVGNSDLHIDGSVSDLPAILHHTDQLVDCRLNLRSRLIDIAQLTAMKGTVDTTKKAAPVDEQIEDFRMKLDFKSSARAFTESKHLPEGEFFIEDFYARLKHYPHTLHDFHADIFVDENDFRIIDFSGMIDTSDFHFHGKLHDYAFWFQNSLQGDTRVEYDLTSQHLRLEDIFSYKGENYVPEDYRHEELSQLKIHGIADLHFRGKFQSADLQLTQWDAKMKVHPLKFRNFKGRIHYEDQHVQIDTLYGQIGSSSFTMDLNYYLGDDEEIRKRDNHLGLHAARLDMDELMNYHAPPASASSEPVDHEAGFNIYELPFSPMTFDIDIKHLNYHKYLIRNFDARLRTERDHHIRIDKLKLDAAGGNWDISGSFDGRNPKQIYMDPVIKIKNVDLDKLLFKFDNFGQDHLISENLHGKLSGTITGHIHVHPDLVPKIDDSELHLDIEVTDGRLENYGPIMAMAEYFGDKNLSAVRFDSLRNHIDMKDGTLSIPNMTLNTTLGHMDFSGSQKVGGAYDMEYYVRVPLKMVTDIAKRKLFGKKNKEEAEAAASEAAEDDEIIYKDDKKKTRYLGIKITGDIEDYKVGLGKDKRDKKKRKKEKKERKEAGETE